MCRQMFVAALFIISQKLESTQRSSNWWMDKQTEIYPCNGIQFSNKKKQTTDTATPWMLHTVQFHLQSNLEAKQGTEI